MHMITKQGNLANLIKDTLVTKVEEMSNLKAS